MLLSIYLFYYPVTIEAIMRAVVFIVIFGLVNAEPEYVTKKLCKDVDQSQCIVYSAIMDPCNKGPAFCNIKKNKKYVLTLDLVPKFSAQKLKLSINGDVKNNGAFSTVIQPPKDACGYLYCPVHAEERRIFDINLSVDKTISGKFPVQAKLWNEENESQACCMTFNVKVK